MVHGRGAPMERANGHHRDKELPARGRPVTRPTGEGAVAGRTAGLVEIALGGLGLFGWGAGGGVLSRQEAQRPGRAG